MFKEGGEEYRGKSKKPHYQTLSQEEVALLNLVEEGKSLEEVKKQAEASGVEHFWKLKDRIRIDYDTQNDTQKRRVDYAPAIMEPGLQCRLKVQGWYKKDPSSIDFERLQLKEIEKSDVSLLNKPEEKLSFWENVRKQWLVTQKENGVNTQKALFNTLTEPEKALLLAKKEELSPFEKEQLTQLEKPFTGRFLKSQRRDLISNEDYFFLCAVRRQEAPMEELALRYGVSAQRLSDLGLIDYLDDKEKEVLLSYQFPDHEQSIVFGDKELAILDSIKERRFITDAGRHTDFLNSLFSLNQKAHPLTTKSLKEASLAAMVTEQELEGLRQRGFIDFLDEEDEKLLKAHQQDPEKLKEELFDKHGPFKGKALYFRYNQKKKLVDCSVKIDLSEKFRISPRVQYREKESLLEFRQNRGFSIELEKSKKNNDLLIKDHLGSKLSLTQKEKVAELNLSGQTAEKCYIPTNKERAFLDHLSFRKLDLQTFEKIAKEDYQIEETDFKNLMESANFETFNQKVKDESGKQSLVTKVLPHKELDEIHLARLYKAATAHAKKSLDKPSDSCLKLLKKKTTAYEPKPKVGDYELYFASTRNDKLSPAQQRRARLLAENGITVKSKKFEQFMQEEPSSFRMKKSRTKAFLGHYEKIHGVNLSALKHINTFKQMTAAQLNYVGLSNDEIAQYKGSVKGLKGSNLINHHVLATSNGAIEYYSLNHEGPISGRKFLEQAKVSKKQIARRPQGRADLLYHDLKVVDAVQQVIELKKKEGKKLVRVENESMQYSRAKLGKLNEERKGGPSFMDAVLVFEEEQTHSQAGGSKKEEMVAVEYGDYPTRRMVSKINSAQFDQAFIFSGPSYMKRYMNVVNQPNVTFGTI